MPSGTDTVRVALIGYGFAGRTFHAPLIQAVPGLSLRLVASRDPARVDADLPGVRVEDDARRAVVDPDIDLVVLASPNATHAPLARRALEAGKHVVVDKPLTPTLAEARELATLATDRGLVLSVFQNRRWDSDFLAIRQAIDAGRIGEVMHFESRIERFRPAVRERWREQPGPATGLWWDLGPHLVDQALLLLGRPDTVTASMALQREGASTDDWAHVVLGAGRRRAILQAGMLMAGGGARFVVHGTQGSLAKRGADPQEAQLIAGMRPGDPLWGRDEDPLEWFPAEGPRQLLPSPQGDQSRYYAEILAAVAGDAAPPVTLAQALDVMAILEAADISAREGRTVTPDY